MKQSASSRRQPLVVMITTSGKVRESVFDEIYRFACLIADGDKRDDTFLPVMYELDSRDEWTDPAKWEKANPGLGTIKQHKTLATFVERAKIKTEDLPGVLCKDFNVQEVSADIWFLDCPKTKFWAETTTIYRYKNDRNIQDNEVGKPQKGVFGQSVLF